VAAEVVRATRAQGSPPISSAAAPSGSSISIDSVISSTVAAAQTTLVRALRMIDAGTAGWLPDVDSDEQ
jgi:hypothetical protein